MEGKLLGTVDLSVLLDSLSDELCALAAASRPMPGLHGRAAKRLRSMGESAAVRMVNSGRLQLLQDPDGEIALLLVVPRRKGMAAEGAGQALNVRSTEGAKLMAPGGLVQ